MERFELAKLAHELPEHVWGIVKELCGVLSEISMYRRKVTGFGGWAILAIVFAIVTSAVLAQMMQSAVPEFLNIEVYPHRVTLLFVGLLIFFGALFCAIGYASGKARYGSDLDRARDKLYRMYFSQHLSSVFRFDFSCALSFLKKCEPGLAEFVSKEITADLKAHSTSLTTPQETA